MYIRVDQLPTDFLIPTNFGEEATDLSLPPLAFAARKSKFANFRRFNAKENEYCCYFQTGPTTSKKIRGRNLVS